MIFYEEILKEFQRQKVNYVLVGGLAVNLLGALRNTSDMDILVEMKDSNLKKIVNILKKKGYGVKQPVDPINIADKKIREDWIKNKNMKAFNFYKENSLREVDIIVDSPVSFEKARKDVIIIKVGDLRIPVVSIRNLIRMKKKAGRDIDKIDIDQLKFIEKARKKR